MEGKKVKLGGNRDSIWKVDSELTQNVFLCGSMDDYSREEICNTLITN
jgi:hypothetical protein